MKLVIQRVAHASVSIEGKIHSSIGHGLLVLIGIEEKDSSDDVKWLVSKVAGMRIFGDNEGKMNLSVKDTGGECLLISQFTLHANTDKGNRPSFIRAARPEQAIPLYNLFISELSINLPQKVHSGIFGADMKVSLLNDGPVTIVMDSRDEKKG